MKALALVLTLVGAALLTSGCSTITSRSEPRNAKAFPAVREHWRAGTGPLGKGDLALLAVGCRAADLAVAVSVDTLLLPYDLLHKPAAGSQADIPERKVDNQASEP